MLSIDSLIFVSTSVRCQLIFSALVVLKFAKHAFDYKSIKLISKSIKKTDASVNDPAKVDDGRHDGEFTADLSVLNKLYQVQNNAKKEKNVWKG